MIKRLIPWCSVLIVILLAATSAAGCGDGSGDGNPASCGLGSCGGAVEGTWVFSDACARHEVLNAALAQTTAQLMARCPGARASNFVIDPVGSMVFNSDGTYSLALGIEASFQLFMPVSCIEPATCFDLELELQVELASDPNFRSVSCTQGPTCVCTATASTAGSETGTYTTSGSSITLTSPTDAIDEVFGYCVQGTTIMLEVPPPDDPTLQDPISALIAQRQ